MDEMIQKVEQGKMTDTEYRSEHIIFMQFELLCINKFTYVIIRSPKFYLSVNKQGNNRVRRLR